MRSKSIGQYLLNADLPSEGKLGIAVINLAIRDYCDRRRVEWDKSVGKKTRVYLRDTRKKHRHNRASAREFLFGDDWDLRFWCDISGLDIYKVRREAVTRKYGLRVFVKLDNGGFVRFWE